MSNWSPPSLDIPTIPDLPPQQRSYSISSANVTSDNNTTQQRPPSFTIPSLRINTIVENTHGTAEVGAVVDSSLNTPTFHIPTFPEQQNAFPVSQQQQPYSASVTPRDLQQPHFSVTLAPPQQEATMHRQQVSFDTTIHDEEVATEYENAAQHKRMSLHVLIKENGSIVTMVSSLFLQIQSDLASVLSAKLLVLPKMSKKVEPSALFRNIFDFRISDFYVNYLRLIKASSHFCTDTFCQFALMTLPQKLFVAHVKSKKHVNPITPQIGGVDRPDASTPIWSFENWVQTIPSFSPSDELHKQIVECVSLIVFADIVTVVLQHYDSYRFRIDLFHEIASVCFAIFSHTEERKTALPVWAAVGDMIFDSFAFVIRRFSSSHTMVEVLKDRIPVGQSSVSKDDIRSGIRGIRFLDVDLRDEANTEATRALFEYYVQLCEHYNKSISIRSNMIELFINSIRQLDFEIQYEARLFETFILSIYNHVEKWMKTKELRANCLRLQATIIAHFLLPFHEKNAESVLKQLLKAKKEDLPSTLEAIGTLLQDKFKIDKNLDLRSIVGPGATSLEHEPVFAGVVYAQADKNTLMFDEEVLTGVNNGGAKDAEFALAFAGFGKRSINHVNLLHTALFDGKKPPYINTNPDQLETVITLYSRVILRMAQFSLDTVLHKTLPNLLVKDWSKNPEVYALAFRVTMLLCCAGADSSAHPLYFKMELDSIKKLPNYTKLIQEFQLAHLSRMQHVLHNICEPVVGINVLPKSTVPLPVTSYQAKELASSSALVFSSSDLEEEDEEEEEEIDTPTTMSQSDFKQISGFSMHRALSKSVHTMNPSVFEQHSAKSKANDFSRVLKRRHSSFTDLPLSKPTKKAQARSRSFSTNKKKDKFLYIFVLIQVLNCLPYIVTENVLASSDENKFVAVNLVYHDIKVASACSHALQRLVFERENLRHTIVRGMAELLFNREDFRDHPATVQTLLDNINVMLVLWKQANDKKLSGTQSQLTEHQIGEKMKISWDMLRGWVDKLEAFCICALCFHNVNVRKSALKVLEAIEDYVQSEGNETMKNWQPRRTCFSLLKEHEHDIVKQAILRLSLEDSFDMESDIEFSFLHADPPTIASLSQRDDSHILWSYIVAMIGQTLVEVGYMDAVFNILKYLVERSKLLAAGMINASNSDESFAFLYTTSLSLLLASTGVPDPNQCDVIVVQSMLNESSATLKKFDLWNNLDTNWVRLALFHSASCTNFQFVSTFYKLILDYTHQKYQSKKYTHEKNISMIYDVSKAMAKISHCSQFVRSFSTHITPMDPAHTIRMASSILRDMNDHINALDYTKLKGVAVYFDITMIKHYICVALRNISWALTWATQKDTIPKVLDAPFSKLQNFAWSPEDRTYWLQFIQRCSRYTSNDNKYYMSIVTKEIDKLKSIDERDQWKEKFDTIQKDVQPRCATDAALYLMTVNPLKTIFPDSMDYESFQRNIEWFVEADKSSTGKSSIVAKILYQHFDMIAKHVVQAIYSETNDDVLEVYVAALHEVFLNPPHDLAPRVSTVAIRVQNWIQSEFLRQVPSAKACDEDIEFTKSVGSFAIELLHVLLFLLNHRSVKIHSQAFEVLYALASVDFGRSLSFNHEQLQTRNMELKELAKLAPSYRTRSTTALEDHAFKTSIVLANVFGSFTTSLLLESFKRFKLIAVPNRKLWLVRNLIPWSKAVELQTNENAHFVASLFELSVDVTSAIGFREDLRELWKEIALKGQPHNPDREPVSFNLQPIIEYMLAMTGASKKRDDVCRNVCTAMYTILPTATIGLLVARLRENEENFEQDDRRCAAVGFIADILGESQQMIPVYRHLSVIIPHVLVYMDKDREGVHIDPNPHQNALLSILMKLTSLITKADNHWIYIEQFLKSSQTVFINWANTPHSKVHDMVKERLRGTDFYEPATELLPFTDYHMSAQQLIVGVLQCVETVLGNDVINHIAHYCLEAATLARSDATLTYKYLTIFKHILSDQNTAAITNRNIHRILTALSQASDHAVKSTSATNTPTTPNTPNCRPSTPSKKSQVAQRTTPQYVGLVCLSLSLLQSIAVRLHERNELESHGNIFWMAVTFLGSTQPDIYCKAIDILCVFKDNTATRDKYFRGVKRSALLRECREYTERWMPPFIGIQPLLLRGMQIPACEDQVLDLLFALLEYQQQEDDSMGGYIEVPTDRRHLTSALLILPRLYREALVGNMQAFRKLCARYQYALNFSSPNIRLTQVFNSQQQIEHPDQFISNCCAEIAYMFLPHHLDYCADVLFSIATESTIELNKGAALKIASYILLVDWNNVNHAALTRFGSVIKSTILESASSISSSSSELYKNNMRELLTISFEIARARKDVTDARALDVERINDASLLTTYGTSHYQFRPLIQSQLYARTNICQQQSQIHLDLSEYCASDVQIEVSETRRVVNKKQTKSREELEVASFELLTPRMSVRLSPRASLPATTSSSTSTFPSTSNFLSPHDAMINVTTTPQQPVQEMQDDEDDLPLGGAILALGLMKPTDEEPATLEVHENKPDNHQIEKEISEDIIREKAPSLSELLSKPNYFDLYQNYMRREHNDESLAFYLAVQDFSSTLAVTDRALVATEIVSNYLKGAHVKMDDTMRTTTLREYSANILQPPTSLFSKVLAHIMSLHETEYYPLFLHSKECKSIVSSLVL